MDVHNIYRNDLYYDDNSYSIFTRYGEASTQADGRPDDSLSNNSLTQVKKICYCFTPKIAITTVLLVTLCFLGMNLYILFDNTFNPNSIENDVIVNVPIFSLKYNLKISYNHLRIAFSFINSFFFLTMDPFDLIASIPSSFEEMLMSKKWLERKEAIENLVNIASKHDDLDPKASYHRLCDQLKQVIAKDANINVAAMAAKLVTILAKGLRNKFKDYGTPFVGVIFEKFKEKKPTLREPLCEAIDAIGDYCPFDNIIEDIVTAMEKPNPAQKSQINLFLGRYFKRFRASDAPKKLIKSITPILAKHCSDSDSEVRETAMSCLGCLMFVIGEKDLLKMVGDLPQDTIKWTKIQETKAEIEEKAKEADAAKAPVKKKKNVKVESEEEEESESEDDPIEQVEEKEIDPFDELEPVDVISRLPDNFFTVIESKKWSERRDALQGLLDLCTTHKRLDPKGATGDIVPCLKRLLEKDANINVAALSAKCLSAFAYGLRQKFAPFVPSIAGVIFEKFKEKKPTLRDPLVELIDNIAAYSCSVETMQEDICTALEKSNPNIKAQVSLFLQRVFKTSNSATLPKKFVKDVAPLLGKVTGVSDPEARDSACAALGALQRVIGEKAIINLLGDAANDKTKMTKINEFCAKMIEENGPAVSEMVQSVHKAGSKKDTDKKSSKKKVVRKKVETESEEDEEPMKPLPKTALSNETDENEGVNEKKVGTKKKNPLGSKNTKSPTSSEEGKPLESILSLNSNKNQRFKDEAKLKLLKWQFEVPQPDHLQQLQSQLKEVVSADVFGRLYNKDFKQQLKALDILIGLCDSDAQAIIANSDLLLKWITLRILETNPTVLLKCLEFGQRICEVYQEQQTSPHDTEVSSFIPFLLLKTGETKEPIRAAVKKLVFTFCEIIPPSKVYGYLVEALKTKNSRMKTECLNIMESIIDECYDDIAGAHSSSFKIIAASISDRDNNVRNGALNCFVAAYRSVGTEIYKLAGKLNDKDKAYLDERIKRSGVMQMTSPKLSSTPLRGKAKIVKPVAAPVVVPHSSVNVTMDEPPTDLCQTYDYSETTNEVSDKRRLTARLNVDLPPFNDNACDVDIDEEFPDLDVDIVETEPPTIKLEDCQDVVKPSPLGSDILNVQTMKVQSIDVSQYHNQIAKIDYLLSQITSTNISEASVGISELFVLLSNRGVFPIEVIKYKIDDIVLSICKDIDFYKENFTIQTPIPENISSFCKSIFNVLLCIMNDAEFIEFIKPETVGTFLSVILGCVSRSHISSNELWKNSINTSLNHATVKLCDNCNYNTVMMGIVDCMSKNAGDTSSDRVFNLARKCMDKLSTLTTKKNYEWDAEICLTAMSTIMKLFTSSQEKIYETTFHAIRNHIQRLIVVNKAKVKEAVDRNSHLKDKVWQYAARCLEKVMPAETAELDSAIMKINGMSNGEIVKLLSNSSIMSCEWDAFFESGKSHDITLRELVLKNVREKDIVLYETIKHKFNLATSLKPGSGKLWSKDILLSDAVYLTGDRLQRLLNNLKKSQEILESVSFASNPRRTHSIPPPGHNKTTSIRSNIQSGGVNTLNQTAAFSSAPIPQFKKPKRLSAQDRELLKEKLAQIRGA
uniref:TOG domain-containing protein n=1 Tax=Strongyloides stercoralis TaxID=6248 RepID=A0AAF5D4A5_STRER